MYKLRFCFEKNGPAAYISHLDLMKALQRSFVRAGLPVKYSQGFNPHIEMSIVVPLSTGYETRCDLCDLDLVVDELPENFVSSLNAVMPWGMKVLHAGPADRPVREIACCSYEISLPAGDTDAMKALFEQPVLLEKRSKRGRKEVDLREYIRQLDFVAEGDKTLCRCVLRAGNDSLNPMYLTQALKNAGLVEQEAVAKYVRTGILDENLKIFWQKP
ncbi:MAG: TIGR03936 family radical SAM-associated protein [Clostridia bacterium]|nr:TIGR03936 family radical SAM-associated protein [Clostridia bacterium]